MVMTAWASSFRAWASIEEQEGIRVPHGLVFPLAVVGAVGAPHGLVLHPEETSTGPATDYDAVFLTVLDSRCLINAATHFAAWGVPFRSADRPFGQWPLVWAGGQGLTNPMPLAPVADLIVLGDAEPCLPALLDLWHVHGNSRRFLRHAAHIPGVYVPSEHDPSTDRLERVFADDITVTLRHSISVSHHELRRVEIARGCPHRCRFCSLGWRAPYRENATGDIIDEIARSGQRLHLQAGDAESHSGITEIRDALTSHGGHDTGWTGRYDSLLDNPDQTIPANKRYAFGVEGLSWRLRHAVGKGYLTHDRLVADTVDFLERVATGSKGRAAWHLIAGLPGERPADVLEFAATVRAIDAARRGREPRNLSIHWQPFQPLPGTPLQWAGCGGGARRLASMLTDLTRLAWLPVRHVTGRTDTMANLCAVLARADHRGADLLEAVAAGPVTIEAARTITGTTDGPLDPDLPLPWDFIAGGRADTDRLRRSYDAYLRIVDDR